VQILYLLGVCTSKLQAPVVLGVGTSTSDVAGGARGAERRCTISFDFFWL
jgi:hypothetical protein